METREEPGRPELVAVPVTAPPPTSQGARGRYMAHLEGLAPGQWYEIVQCKSAKQATSVAAHLRKRVCAKLGGQWEVLARGGSVYGKQAIEDDASQG